MLRWSLTHLLFPLHFLAALCGSLWLVRAGYSAGVVLAVCTFATAAIVAVMERIHPKHRDWLDSHGDVRADVFHALVSMIGLPQVLEVGVKGLMLTWVVSPGWDSGIWPHEAPMVLQLALAMVTSQLGVRDAPGVSRGPLLRRLHAVHQPHTAVLAERGAVSPARGDADVSDHPRPAGAGGYEEVMLLVTCWTAVHGLYQHRNIDVRLGPLNYLLPAGHRWPPVCRGQRQRRRQHPALGQLAAIHAGDRDASSTSFVGGADPKDTWVTARGFALP